LAPLSANGVGAGFVPLWEPVNPVLTVVPGAMTVLYRAGVTSTRLPICEYCPPQPCLICWPAV